jgi:hypothetical protein
LLLFISAFLVAEAFCYESTKIHSAASIYVRDRPHLNALWEAAYRNSGEIEDAFSTVLPNANVDLVKSEFFEKFGMLILEDAFQQCSSRHSLSIDSAKSVFNQKSFIDDYKILTQDHRGATRYINPKYEIRKLMKTVRDVSIRSCRAFANFESQKSRLCDSKRLLEHLKSVPLNALTTADEKHKYDLDLRKQQEELVAAEYDFNLSILKVKKLIGESTFNKLVEEGKWD